jgi:hypothetical protein
LVGGKVWEQVEQAQYSRHLNALSPLLCSGNSKFEILNPK